MTWSRYEKLNEGLHPTSSFIPWNRFVYFHKLWIAYLQLCQLFSFMPQQVFTNWFLASGGPFILDFFSTMPLCLEAASKARVILLQSYSLSAILLVCRSQLFFINFVSRLFSVCGIPSWIPFLGGTSAASLLFSCSWESVSYTFIGLYLQFGCHVSPIALLFLDGDYLDPP